MNRTKKNCVYKLSGVLYGGGMKTNLTPRAQQVLALARTAASELNQDFIGPEHLLFGLIGMGVGCGIAALNSLGYDMKILLAIRDRLYYRSVAENTKK